MLDNAPPIGWRADKLISLVTLKRGYDLPVAQRKGGDVPVVASNGPVGWHDEAMVNGPVVVTGRSGTIGKVELYEGDCHPLNTTLYSQDLHGNDPRYVAEFLRYFRLDRFATGTGVPTLNRNLVHAELIAIPPLAEQQRIAEILTSVDDSISATEAVIAQAERVKRGLMEDLLTGGLGSVAIARGEVPNGWTPVRLRDFVRNKTEKWIGDDPAMPYVGLEHIGQINGELEGVGSAKEVVSAKNKFEVNDVLFGKLRPNLKKYWLASLSGICSTDILVLSPKNGMLNEFLFYFVQSNKFLNLAISDASGTKMPRTSWKRLSDLEFPLPSIVEQQRIADVLKQVDNTIRANKTTVATAQSLKRGLMDDLLTGRVRTV